MEDADDRRLYVDSSASCAHDAQRAHVLVVAEHVMLPEPEPQSSRSAQPRYERIPAPYVPCHRVVTWNVPDDIRIDEGFKRGLIVRPERVRGPTICAGVRVLAAHVARSALQSGPQTIERVREERTKVCFPAAFDPNLRRDA